MSTYVRNLAKPMQGCLPFGRSLDFTFFNGRVSTSAFCYAISDSNHFMSPSHNHTVGVHGKFSNPPL